MTRSTPRALLRLTFLTLITTAAPSTPSWQGALAAGPQTFTVTRTDDTVHPCVPGDCSLRAAIRAANASPGADVVIVPAGIYTLTLRGTDDDGAAGDLDITESVEIVGAGPHDTIVQAGTSSPVPPSTCSDCVDRVFDVVGAGQTVVVSGLTIRNGSAPAGGGIRNGSDSSLTVSDCVISGNAADGNGGGIQNWGARATSLVIDASTLANNRADSDGGGISNEFEAAAAVTNSTLADNVAGVHGGGIYSWTTHAAGLGGGAQLLVTQSTLSGNDATLGGGIYHKDNVHVTIAETTFRGNGAIGLVEDIESPMSLRDSILADNGAGCDCGVDITELTSGDFQNEGGNLVTSTAPCAPTGITFFGQFCGRQVTSGQLNLGPLADNGGPTATHALLPGSVAIGAATQCGDADQRGVPRPGDDVPPCDSGAYEVGSCGPTAPPAIECPEFQTVQDEDFSGEVQLTYAPVARACDGSSPVVTCSPFSDSSFPVGTTTVTCTASDAAGNTAACSFGVWVKPLPPPFTVTRTDDPPPDGCAPGDCSLREAIIAANVTPGADVILVPDGTYTLTIPGAGEDGAATGDLDITDDVTVVGASRNGTIIQGGSSSPVPPSTCADCVDRVFDVLTPAAAALEHLTIRHGYAGDDYGGGIRIHSVGGLTLDDCAVASNSAARGGGIALPQNGAQVNSTAVLRDSTVSGNRAVDRGGGVYAEAAEVTVATSTLSGNTAAHGGGIFGFFFSNLAVEDSTISGNDADGIFAQFSGVTIRNSTLSGNSGFGVDNNSSDTQGSATTISNSTIAHNEIGLGTSQGMELAVKNSIIADNDADWSGPIPEELGGDLGGNLSTTPIFSPEDSFSFVSSAELMLGPLQDNGGPTQTHALLPGSVAIDHLSAARGFACTGPSTDQRGALRPTDGDGDGAADCDAGAFEAPAASPTTTSTSTTSSTTTTSTPTTSSTTTTSTSTTSSTTTTSTSTTSSPSTSSTTTTTLPPSSTCGNGVVESGEECDDGNTAGGDCCSPTCQIEADGTACGGDQDACVGSVCRAGLCTVGAAATFSSTDCRLTALQAAVLSSTSGRIQTTLLHTLTLAIDRLKQADEFVAAGDTRHATSRLRNATRKLSSFARRVRSLTGRRNILPPAVANDLLARTSAIQADIEALVASM